MQIVQYPHPALRWKSKPIRQVTRELRETVAEMFRLMYEFRGIGLAANQVALPYQLFVLNLTADREQKDQEQVFVNPEIVERRGSVEHEEGCLSLPALFGKVRRARKLRIQAYDLEGNEIEQELDDLASRAVQHECDHLQGMLFIDRMSFLGRLGLATKLKELEWKFRQAQDRGEFPAVAQIEEELRRLEADHETLVAERI